MAINWKWNANDVEEAFPLIPAGDHRMRIAKTEETKSKSGNDMIKVTLDISGQPGKLFHYIVFMPDNTTMTNTNLARFWDSFGIDAGNLNTPTWVGRVGAGRVKHEDYNGETQARISYLIEKKKQEKLPAWQEPGNKSANGTPNWVANAENSLPPFDTDDLPL